MSKKNFNQNKDITIFRSPHDGQNPYVQILRAIFEDREISPKAKGILGYLLSRTDRWDIYHCQLQHALNIGEEYLNSALQELIDAGYARRTRIRIKGQFQPYRYEISESKKFLPNGEIPSGDFSQCKTPPQHGFNQTGKTGPENPAVHNNDLHNNHSYVKNNVPPYPPFEKQKKTNEKSGGETMFSKERRKGRCSFSGNQSLPKRFKLTDQQIETVENLKSLKIDTSEETLCWWAKNYSLSRILEVYHDAKSKKPLSIAAYIQKLLKVNAYVAKAHAAANAEFAQDFKNAAKWYDLEIGNLYVIFPCGNGTQDLSLNLEPMQFAETLMYKHANINNVVD